MTADKPSTSETRPTAPLPGVEPTDVKLPDPVAFTKAMTNTAERSQEIVRAFLARQHETQPSIDPLNLGGAFMAMSARMMADPTRLVQAQFDLWQDCMRLWQSTTTRMLGGDPESVIKPEAGDRRFKDEAWDESALFDFIKQSYLLSARWIRSAVEDVDGLDDKTAQKIDFYSRQFVDAMAPSNFLMTNPQVLRETLESGGENLINGLDNLLGDLEAGKGRLKISMTDTEAFEVGGNIAVTPGQVVYQNDLMQLIQYEPTTEKVFKRPLIIIPPWINKFYILDLRPKNSFIKWAVDQGLTVFVVSWVNPDQDLAAKTFEDYMFEGPLAARDVVRDISGEEDPNVIGYCLGGTLLASTLAYLRAKDRGDAFKSATFFTTMVDFESPGELGVFIDEEQLAALEKKMADKGYLEPDAMATTFNMLRANDLIWSFVVNNYLLGKDPFPFDLLYWNQDSTAMPRSMHSFYLRKMYQENRLREPGGITLDDTPIDLTTIDLPVFVLSTKEDHIAPWKSTFAATHLYSGSVKFCLSASGHIAGVVNPPAAGKYGFWTNTKKAKTPDAWLEGATETPGSWWPEWLKWIARHGGAKVPARPIGSEAYPALEPAPGSYVKRKAG